MAHPLAEKLDLRLNEQDDPDIFLRGTLWHRQATCILFDKYFTVVGGPTALEV